MAGVGSMAAWPLVAGAQQGERARRIGVLMGSDENDPDGKAQFAGLTQGLAELGWSDNRNLRIDVRWTDAKSDRIQAFAKELVELQPELIVSHTTPVTAGLQRATQTIPIVFVQVSDPVGDGFVTSLSRPGGNSTGFINHESSIAGKWVQLLREVAPGIKRIAAVFNPDTAPGGGLYFLAPFEAATRLLNIELITARVRSEAEIETVINSLGREPGGAFVQMSGLSLEPQTSDFVSGRAKQCTGRLQCLQMGERGRLDVLWTRAGRYVSPLSNLCRSHSAWRKARRASGSSAC
jgi:putative tryptophan/tyrosine transport system substrate-binding protein